MPSGCHENYSLFYQEPECLRRGWKVKFSDHYICENDRIECMYKSFTGIMYWRCWQEATMIDVRSVCEMQNLEVVCKMWKSLNPKSSMSPIKQWHQLLGKPRKRTRTAMWKCLICLFPSPTQAGKRISVSWKIKWNQACLMSKIRVKSFLRWKLHGKKQINMYK